jgi:hypothetical protein
MKTARKLLLSAILTGFTPLLPTAFAQCNAPKCLAGVAATASGELLAMYSLADVNGMQVVNVSQLVGQAVAGPLTRWQTPDGPFTVEHLAGVNPAGELLVFYWLPGSDSWGVVNVSNITGQRVLGPLVNWLTQDGPYTVEHLAGVSADGRLLVFYWSPAADWQAVDVSAITGQRLANVSAPVKLPGQPSMIGQHVIGPLTAWQTRVGEVNTEFLAGVSEQGDVLFFSWTPATDWRAVNVSGTTGQRVSGPLGSWQLTQNSFYSENLAGVSASGDLLVFYRQVFSPLRALGDFFQPWRAINVSRITQKQVSDPVTPWASNNLDYLVATGLNERGYYLFWNLGTGRDANPGWGYCDIAVVACTGTLHAP